MMRAEPHANAGGSPDPQSKRAALRGASTPSTARPCRNSVFALVCAVFLGGCGSAFDGFSILPPEEPQRLPIVIDVNAARTTPGAGDPAVTPLIEGQPRASTSLIRILGEVPPHLHEHSDETIYILSGKGQMLLNREWREVGEGMLIHVPKAVPHGFRNEAEEGTWVLSTYTPPHVIGDRVPIEYDPS